ncbi:MAG: S41 family peptidase [Bacillota bacterium]
MKARTVVWACVVIMLFSAFLVPSCLLSEVSDSQTGSLSAYQKIEDFRYLFSKVAAYYPYLELKVRTEGFDWLAHRGAFERMVRNSRNDEDFAEAIGRIVNSLNNCHTHVMPGWMYRYYENDPVWWEEAAKTSQERVDYWNSLSLQALGEPGLRPFVAEYIAGEYVVTSVAPEIAVTSGIHPGLRVLAVNGVPVHDFVASHRGRWFLAYDPDRKTLFEFELRFSVEPNTVDFVDPQGRCLAVDVGWAKSVWTPSFSYSLPRMYAATQEILMTTIEWQGVESGYLYIPTMKSDWQSDTARLREFFESIRHLSALIIDIRGNGGGNDAYWRTNLVYALDGPNKEAENTFYAVRTKLVEDLGMPVGETKAQFAARAGKLKDNVPREVWGSDFSTPVVYGWPSGSDRRSVPFDGQIYVLTSRANFSSAEAFAAYCKASGFATLVGTTTGGDGISKMPGIVVLPNSGIAIRLRLTMGLNPDLTANEEFHTEPDVAVEQSLEDLVAWLNWIEEFGPAAEPMPSFDTVLRTCLELIARSE